jgi:hypothetical protein
MLAQYGCCGVQWYHNFMQLHYNFMYFRIYLFILNVCLGLGGWSPASHCRDMLDLRAVHMGFVVDRVALRFFSEYVRFPISVSCHLVPVLIFHSSAVSAT